MAFFYWFSVIWEILLCWFNVILPLLIDVHIDAVFGCIAVPRTVSFLLHFALIMMRYKIFFIRVQIHATAVHSSTQAIARVLKSTTHFWISVYTCIVKATLFISKAGICCWTRHMQQKTTRQEVPQMLVGIQFSKFSCVDSFFFINQNNPSKMRMTRPRIRSSDPMTEGINQGSPQPGLFVGHTRLHWPRSLSTNTYHEYVPFNDCSTI